MNTEFKRMRELAGLTEIKVNEPGYKYYALFNYDGSLNNGIALYIKTATKEKMVEKLNKGIKEFAGMFTPPYELKDMDESTYIGNSYINDDWAIVTSDVDTFKEILDIITQLRDKQPEQYKG